MCLRFVTVQKLSAVPQVCNSMNLESNSPKVAGFKVTTLSNSFCFSQGVFRLTTKENVEYLFQAADDNEREDWTTAIANAIRKLDIKYKVIQCYKIKALQVHYPAIVQSQYTDSHMSCTFCAFFLKLYSLLCMFRSKESLKQFMNRLTMGQLFSSLPHK